MWERNCKKYDCVRRKGFVGEKGTVGDIGQNGQKGDRGDIGEQGPRGEKGPRGDRGFTGENGDQGTKGELLMNSESVWRKTFLSIIFVLQDTKVPLVQVSIRLPSTAFWMLITSSLFFETII